MELKSYDTGAVKFYNINEIDSSLIFAAVIVSRYRGKWIFCKHKERETWEIPGGHREENETVLQTAKRELFEETGAKEFNIIPICAYSLNRYAMLLFAEVAELGDLPESEIEIIGFFSDLPNNLTYPMLHTALFNKAKAFLKGAD